MLKGGGDKQKTRSFVEAGQIVLRNRIILQ